MNRPELTGIVRCALADGWRFKVPSRWRDALAPGSTLVMMVDPQASALCIYPSGEFQNLASAVLARADHGATQQLLDACEACEVDRQGRIAVPRMLRAALPGVHGALVLAGQGDHVQLWSAAAFDRLQAVSLVATEDGRPPGLAHLDLSRG